MTTYYINPSLSADGSGTLLDPWNTLNHVAIGGSDTFSGGGLGAEKDNGGDIILIKTDTEIRETLDIQYALNFRIGTYGDGEFPIINGSDIVTGTWKFHTGNIWYLESVTASKALHLPGQRIIGRDALAKIEQYQSFWDTGTNRIYCDFGGANPNNHQIEMTARVKGLFISHSTDFEVTNTDTQKAAQVNCGSIGTCDRMKWLYNKSSYAGDWSGQTTGFSRSNFSIFNDSTLATDVIIRGNISQYAQNNGIEFGGFDGAYLEYNDLLLNGSGLEMWNTTQNSFIRRNKVIKTRQESPDTDYGGHGSALWVVPQGQNPPLTGHHHGNKIEYNAFVGSSNKLVDHHDGNDCLYRNNLFADYDPTGAITDGSQPMINVREVTGTTNNTGIVFNNNIHYQKTRHRFMHTRTATTHDYNQYYTEDVGPNGYTYFTHNNTHYPGNTPPVPEESFNAFQVVQETNGAYGDPLINDLDQGDYGIPVTSPAYQAGVDLSLLTDLNKYPIYSTPNIGPIENKLTTDVSVGTSNTGE